MNVTVRRATIADAPGIAESNRQMAWETEHKALDPVVVGRGVARVFDDPAKGYYLVAESGGQVVGQLMVTFEWSDWRDGWFWWLQSVYVAPDHRRQRVFGRLFEAVVREAADARNVVGLRLYVERENGRAQATYETLGMVDPGYLVREMIL